VDNIISLCYQKDSNFVWIASYPFGGISKFFSSTWQTFNPSNSNLPTYDVNGVAVDDSNNVWLSTSAGICKFNGITWQIFDTSNTHMTNMEIVGKPRFDLHSNQWFASNYMGLIKLDDSNWSFYDTTNSPLVSNTTTTLFVDRNDNKWVGTYNGVYIYNDSSIILNSIPTSLNNLEEFVLFPNPSSSVIRVQSVSKIVRCRIYDEEGKLVKEVSFDDLQNSENISISVEELSSGFYLVNLYLSNGKLFNAKLFKL
jgi:ligand-binding sensor domain-containing protein